VEFEGVDDGVEGFGFGDGVDFGLHPLFGHDHGVEGAAFVEDVDFDITAFDAHFDAAAVFAGHDVGDDEGDGEDEDEAGEDEAEAISEDLPGIEALSSGVVSEGVHGVLEGRLDWLRKVKLCGCKETSGVAWSKTAGV
jgi:hypothetical protein